MARIVTGVCSCFRRHGDAVLCAGVDGDVGEHDDAALPRLHEQRPDRADRVADPDAASPLPHDGVHAAHHRHTGAW